jgi:hypothetical protein
MDETNIVSKFQTHIKDNKYKYIYIYIYIYIYKDKDIIEEDYPLRHTVQSEITEPNGEEIK